MATFNCPEYKDFVGCIVRGAFSSGPKKPYELSFGLPVMCFEPPKIDYDQDRSIFMSKLTDCMVKDGILIATAGASGRSGKAITKYLLHPSCRRTDYQEMRPESVWVAEFLYEEAERSNVKDAMETLNRFFEQRQRSISLITNESIERAASPVPGSPALPNSSYRAAVKRQRSNSEGSDSSSSSDPSSPIPLMTPSSSPPLFDAHIDEKAAGSVIAAPQADASTTFPKRAYSVVRSNIIRSICPSLSEDVLQQRILNLPWFRSQLLFLIKTRPDERFEVVKRGYFFGMRCCDCRENYKINDEHRNLVNFEGHLRTGKHQAASAGRKKLMIHGTSAMPSTHATQPAQTKVPVQVEKLQEWNQTYSMKSSDSIVPASSINSHPSSAIKSSSDALGQSQVNTSNTTVLASPTDPQTSRSTNSYLELTFLAKCSTEMDKKIERLESSDRSKRFRLDDLDKVVAETRETSTEKGQRVKILEGPERRDATHIDAHDEIKKMLKDNSAVVQAAVRTTIRSHEKIKAVENDVRYVRSRVEPSETAWADCSGRIVTIDKQCETLSERLEQLKEDGKAYREAAEKRIEDLIQQNHVLAQQNRDQSAEMLKRITALEKVNSTHSSQISNLKTQLALQKAYAETATGPTSRRKSTRKSGGDSL